MATTKKNSRKSSKSLSGAYLNLGRKGKAIYGDLLASFPGGNRADELILEGFARILELAHQADKELCEKGLIQEYQNKTRAVSPEWAILRNSLDAARAYWKDIHNKVGTDQAEDVEGDAKRVTLSALMPNREAL